MNNVKRYCNIASLPFKWVTPNPFLGGEDAVNLGETTAAAEDLTQSPDCDHEVFPES